MNEEHVIEGRRPRAARIGDSQRLLVIGLPMRAIEDVLLLVAEPADLTDYAETCAPGGSLSSVV